MLKQFFAYQPPAYEQWEQAVGEFKARVPDLATGLLDLIRNEYRTNLRFIRAFDAFANLCRQTLNPNLSTQAVEEMLIQHLLTERIFRKVFNNHDFVERNIIAREIEHVIQALTAQHFSRHSFLHPLDRFYGAIEETAATIEDYSEKQGFLNTVYEQFFQGFSVKVTDTTASSIPRSPSWILWCGRWRTFCNANLAAPSRMKVSISSIPLWGRATSSCA